MEHLFLDYQREIEDFHDWYRKTIEDLGRKNLEEYRQYDRILKAIGSRAWWNLVIDYAQRGGIDPYERLAEYLEEDELREVLSLPHRSKEQVNKIIELVDEYGACDEELRQRVYRLFKVEPL